MMDRTGLFLSGMTALFSVIAAVCALLRYFSK